MTMSTFRNVDQLKLNEGQNPLSQTAEESDWAEKESWLSKTNMGAISENVAKQKIVTRLNYFGKWWCTNPDEGILKTQTQTGLRQKYFSSLQNFRNIVYENCKFSSWDEHIWRQNLMALVTITINIGPDTIKEIFLVKWTRWTESGVSGKWGMK